MQKEARFIRIGLAAAAGVAGLFASPINWSSPQNGGLITQAQARVGNPLTPGSVSGVGRRVERRTARGAYRGAYYGTGAAIGTAAALGAAGAYWGSQYYNAYPSQYYGTYPGRYYGAYTGRTYGTYPGQYYGSYPGGYYGSYTGQSYAAYPRQYYGTYPGQYAQANSNQNYGGSAFSDGSYTYSGLTEATEIANRCAMQSTGTFLGDDGKQHPCPSRPTI